MLPHALLSCLIRLARTTSWLVVVLMTWVSCYLLAAPDTAACPCPGYTLTPTSHLAGGVDDPVQCRLIHAVCPPLQHVPQVDNEAARPVPQALIQGRGKASCGRAQLCIRAENCSYNNCAPAHRRWL